MFSLQSHKMRLKRMGTDILMHRGLLESHESTDTNGNHRQDAELMGLKLRKELERWIEEVDEARYQHAPPKFPSVKRKSMNANTAAQEARTNPHLSPTCFSKSNIQHD